jgi:hypothetical protein
MTPISDSAVPFGPNSISILGGCTTRDIFRIAETDSMVHSLWARMTVPSIIAPPVASLLYEEGFTPEGFEVRQSWLDVNKLFFKSFSTIRPKVLLVDFMAEVYGLGLEGDGVVTLAEHTRKRRDEFGIKLRTLPPFSDERLAMMRESLPVFFGRLRAEFGTTILVHEVYQAESVRSSDGSIATFPSQQLDQVRLANRHLTQVYDAVRAGFPDIGFFGADKNAVLADREHRWGLWPFHFVPEYYLSAFDQLKARLHRLAPA